MGDTLRLGPLALPWGMLFPVRGLVAGHLGARAPGAPPGPRARSRTAGGSGWRRCSPRAWVSCCSTPLNTPAPLGPYSTSATAAGRPGGAWPPRWPMRPCWPGGAARGAAALPSGFAAGAGVTAGLAAQHWGGPGPAPLPRWQGVALDASTVVLPALRGQPVVVNLWATWCPPCRREMPVLRQARAQHPQVRFLWIDQGEAPDVVQRFAAQHGLPPADVLLDPTPAWAHCSGAAPCPPRCSSVGGNAGGGAHGRAVAGIAGAPSGADTPKTIAASACPQRAGARKI